MRLAACLGIGLDVIEPCGFPLSDRAIKRAAMDYAVSADIARHDSWAEFLKARKGSRLVLFTTRSAEPLHRFAFEPSDVLLFGRESAGVPEEVHALADARLIIPIRPETRSLNVVTAAAIAAAEALRQTHGFPQNAKEPDG